jgi:hypothetical protein
VECVWRGGGGVCREWMGVEGAHEEHRSLSWYVCILLLIPDEHEALCRSWAHMSCLVQLTTDTSYLMNSKLCEKAGLKS